MTLKHNLIAIAFSALGMSAAWAQAASDVPNQPEPTVILVPVLVTDPALESGCWAQFFAERNFKGDVATLVGPAGVVTLDKGRARELKREIDSLVLGPKAVLTVYQHAYFKDGAVTFQSNSREPGLIKKLGFGGRIESMRLECTN